MKTILVKTHKGKPVVRIEKNFDDAVSLSEFLNDQGFYISIADAASDILRPSVTYTLPLLGAENEQR